MSTDFRGPLITKSWSSPLCSPHFQSFQMTITRELLFGVRVPKQPRLFLTISIVCLLYSEVRPCQKHSYYEVLSNFS